MARKPMMAGNWKMNNAIGEAVVLTQEISNNWWKDWEDKVDVVICPPFVDLKPVKTVLEFDKTKIFVGAQNVYWEEAGAFTGEVSVPMIRECGCDYCIVGHSERRGLFGETNEDVNNRFVGELAYAPHRTRNEDARYGRQETDREEQEIGFHGWVCTPVPQRMELSSDSEGEIKNVGQNSDLLSEALE